MASNSLAPLLYQGLQQGLKHVDLRNLTDGLDLRSFVTGLDVKTVSWVALIVVALIFIYDLWKKSSGHDATALAVSAADYWQDNRDQFTYDPYYRGSRSLEPLTEVLDALADAVKKWESTQQDTVRNRSQ
ncbi:uncharacterized protein [Macrobrachium rosenbergii]|uniref:uncharacterized protein n=1 Tax=Macrobrachium rosenbergii TaxID=79674 RepID=UPI0034D6C289